MHNLPEFIRLRGIFAGEGELLQFLNWIVSVGLRDAGAAVMERTLRDYNKGLVRLSKQKKM